MFYTRVPQKNMWCPLRGKISVRRVSGTSKRAEEEDFQELAVGVNKGEWLFHVLPNSCEDPTIPECWMLSHCVLHKLLDRDLSPITLEGSEEKIESSSMAHRSFYWHIPSKPLGKPGDNPEWLNIHWLFFPGVCAPSCQVQCQGEKVYKAKAMGWGRDNRHKAHSMAVKQDWGEGHRWDQQVKDRWRKHKGQGWGWKILLVSLLSKCQNQKSNLSNLMCLSRMAEHLTQLFQVSLDYNQEKEGCKHQAQKSTPRTVCSNLYSAFQIVLGSRIFPCNTNRWFQKEQYCGQMDLQMLNWTIFFTVR